MPNHKLFLMSFPCPLIVEGDSCNTIERVIFVTSSIMVINLVQPSNMPITWVVKKVYGVDWITKIFPIG